MLLRGFRLGMRVRVSLMVLVREAESERRGEGVSKDMAPHQWPQ